MEEDDQETLLKQVFGDSSSDSELETQQESLCAGGFRSTLEQNHHPTWEPIEKIKGLWICRDFLSPHQQSNLLSAIHTEGWFTEASNNQAMRFGDLPSWAIQLSNTIREVVLYGSEEEGLCKLPPEILWREPLFDQLIVNVYHPGEGICAHVDLLRFEDGIAIISLESSCVMHFTRVGEVCDFGKGQQYQPITKVPVYLTPGSLVLLFGDARYLWKHEINRKPGFQVWEGLELSQKKRTSITLRKLCLAG